MPRSSSTYADEGTLAHELCAASVSLALQHIDQNQYNQIVEECKQSELWDDVMLEHAQTYRDYTVTQLTNADTLFADVEVTGLSLEPYVPKAFGTADFISYDGQTLNVCDFKYGKGVPVSPEQNEQLMLYALGALMRYELQDNAISVMLHIIQPRISQPQSWTISSKELMKWAEETVRPKAAQAAKGEGGYCPNSSTCRFCRAKPICKALAANIFESVKSTPSLDTMSLEEVGSALKKASLLKQWLNAMEDYVKDALMKGQVVKGFKLVEGRSSRKICDAQKAAVLLRKAGFPDEMTHKLTLFGITDLERLVGKKKLPDVLGDTLIKPQGSPTMVDESDPRPPMDSRDATLKMFEEVNL
jgi:hypothetical protein